MNSNVVKEKSEDYSRLNKSLITSPILTFIIGSTISMIIFFIVQSGIKSEIQSIFESKAQNRLASLQTDIVRHQEMVNSIAGLFSSSQNVTRKEFHAFVNNTLTHYPYIQGFSWNPLIKKSDHNKFIEKARIDGIDDFEITELDSNGKIIKAPVRDEYITVYFIEPHLNNREAVGFNIASNPARMKAIEQARDTGLPVITERIKLVQEKQDYYGYLLLKAIYKKGSVLDTVSERRENFTGLAVGVFRFKDWIPSSMRDLEPSGIDIWISDVSSADGQQILHFHSSRTRKEVYQPTQQNYLEATKGMHWQTTIDISGRQWSFLFVPTPAFIDKHLSWLGWILLIAGLIITLLLTMHQFSHARYSAKLANTNRELLEALSEIKSLKGIIPICSYCHKIRDDEGAWNQLESYLKEHSEAEFSHGICPDCLKHEHDKFHDT